MRLLERAMRTTANLPVRRGGRRGRGGGGGPQNLDTVSSRLNTALGVAQSADRTPPATAYAAYEQASRDLAAQLASWKTLRDVKLAELNRELRQANLPPIEPW